jgi:hypothetical protein
MMDLSSAKGRLMAMVGIDGLATAVAAGAAYAATTLNQDAYWAVFGVAVIAGFAANIWFIAGLRRAKQGD